MDDCEDDIHRPIPHHMDPQPWRGMRPDNKKSTGLVKQTCFFQQSRRFVVRLSVRTHESACMMLRHSWGLMEWKMDWKTEIEFAVSQNY